MDQKRLMWIKLRQKEYQDLFNEKLEIDFALMNGVQNKTDNLFCTLTKNQMYALIDREFKKLLKKYNLKKEIVRINRKPGNQFKRSESDMNVRAFLISFCTFIHQNRLNVKYAGSLINKERTLINYYAGRCKSIKQK
jgi:hypothetical protein